MTTTALVQELSRLLDLDHSPVAVTFHRELRAELGSRPAPEPAGCCFWARAESERERSLAADAVVIAHADADIRKNFTPA
ncbi:MAG: hypothetical protein E6G34_14525 [Actinobacteria bacterium]|nr:MAG: hypothetical protein E6G34_14525 [Actinomycetota bacterium]